MNIDLIRAWKDEQYRDSLTEKELAALPQNPAGLVELSDEDLNLVEGAQGEDLPLSVPFTTRTFPTITISYTFICIPPVTL